MCGWLRSWLDVWVVEKLVGCVGGWEVGWMCE